MPLEVALRALLVDDRALRQPRVVWVHGQQWLQRVRQRQLEDAFPTVCVRVGSLQVVLEQVPIVALRRGDPHALQPVVGGIATASEAERGSE